MGKDYSILGLESLVNVLKDNKKLYFEKVVSELNGEQAAIANAIGGNLNTFIQMLENKLTDIKAKTHVEL